MSARLLKVLLWAVVGVLLLFWYESASGQNPPIEIQDTEFTVADWDIGGVELTSGALVTADQTVDGGNPGPFRHAGHFLPYPAIDQFSRATSVHIFDGYKYSPLTQGPLRFIDFEVDVQTIFGPPEFDTYLHAAILQNFRVFRTNHRLRLPDDSAGWNAVEMTGLRLQDFWSTDGTCEHPDSSLFAGLMSFGFALTTGESGRYWPLPPFQDANLDFGADNWRVGLWPETVPDDPTNHAPLARDDVEVLWGGLYSHGINVIANDSDPDYDPLLLRSVSPARFGLTRPSSNEPEEVVYELLGGSTIDSFCYSVMDLRALPKFTIGRVRTRLDCSCAANCIVGSRPPSTKGDSLDLELIYRVRDEIFADGISGRRFIDYYYESTPELIELLVVDEPTLGSEAVSVAELWSPLFADHLDGPGDAPVTQAQVDALDTFVSNLSASASPNLQLLISDEMNNLGDLQDYVGMTSTDALIKALLLETVFADGFEGSDPAQQAGGRSP